MKGVLAWAKGHLVVVISVVIAVAALPALLFVSTGKNTALRESVQEDVGGLQRNLKQISVNYAAESLDPAHPSDGFTATPNEATTAAMRAVIEANDHAAEEILEIAEKWNRRGKAPLLEGLFPEPDPAEGPRLRQEAGPAWVRAHEELLDRAGAGGPVSDEELLVQLQSREIQERDKRLNVQGTETLSPADEAEIRQTLVDFRLQRLRERADDVTFYADMGTFVGVGLPESGQLPSLAQIWDWQHRLWIDEDLIDAAVAANTDHASGLVLAPSARPVKRVESITIAPWTYTGADGSSAPPLTQEIRPDFAAAITGRAGWPLKTNALYNVRYSTVVAELDSAGIERFIDAIEAQNLMTVIDLDLTTVSPAEGLAAGYAYESGRVVRAEMLVETVWLRSWLAEVGPSAVRAQMGLPAPEETAGAPAEGFDDE